MKGKLFISVFIFFFVVISSCTDGHQEKKDTNGTTNVVLAYVTSRGELPNPQHVTHINFAFGVVNRTFDGIDIGNKQRLHEISALKQQKPSLKVLISIGGWTAGRFSEMASTEQTRKAFARDCKRIIDEFNLDGIDMDWEYPSSSEAGISSSPDDIDNFTLLMKDIRAEIGKDKLLTLATIATAQYIDFKAINQYIDLVNDMMYDVSRPPLHHSALYRSQRAGKITVEESIKAHLDAGVPKEKLVLGVPFYGHGIDSLPDYVDYRRIVCLDGYNRCWDDSAKVPYLTNEDGKFVLCYDNSKSIREKCKYVIDNKLRGVMYWEYSCDDRENSLANTIYDTIFY